ncbi:unnamed protein product [Arctia plantaginis]|uniref:Peptidase S1 domain-containing protein n=1 Tax=Arctia plantaginis TaxID=874455 RepID=A0A8S1B476_ARCPL|nr:unnamed protein product [Arctia plantaginis]
MWCEMKDLHFCHDDFSLNPPDGLLDEYSFPWLGFTQYLHEMTGLLHPNIAPRVVLVHKQFVITSAREMLKLPKHYKLGNMIFGDYEQEGKDCDLTSDDIMMGKRCPRAYMEMPFKEILPHPEFSRFRVNNSVALVQLLRPMKSPVPRDFDFEKMGKRTLQLYKDTDCMRYHNNTMMGNKDLSQFLCTSGCGMRPGTPIISHAPDGRFEVIGIAVGGSRCVDHEMRRSFNENPPFYIDVYPYVPWIINVINAHKIPKPYPEHFQLLEGGSLWIRPIWCGMSEINICHDDFNLNPTDGVLKDQTFPWLGFALYIHGLINSNIFEYYTIGQEVTGMLHPARAPRVVLVHNQFVLTMARDVLKLPRLYKLGNVIFGEYEREEKDCGLTSQDILKGYKCPRAFIEIPLNEILPHPEFSR